MANVLQQFESLARAVNARHNTAGLVGSGHDFFHAVRVAAIAIRIAPDSRSGELAAIAGLCHNADRVLEKELGIGTRRLVPHETLLALLDEWLAHTDLADLDRETVKSAVLRHDHQNSSDDSQVQIILMDADRLVNLQADVIMRAAQFYPDLPAIDPIHGLNDPNATFREPRSVLRDICHNLEWADRTKTNLCFRLPAAWEIGLGYVGYLCGYMERVQQELRDAGLDPDNLPDWLKS